MNSGGGQAEWGVFAFDEDRLEVSILRQSGAEAETGTVAGPPEDALAGWSAAHAVPEHLTVVLPTREVLMMVVDLPTVDPGEIAGMVELLAEEISPFTPERTQVGWEVLGPAAGNASRVLLALTSLQKLEPLHDRLQPVTGLPARVDVAVLGWLELLRGEGHLTNTADTWVLWIAEGAATLVAWHAGGPVLIRSLGGAGPLTADGIREELDQARLGVETGFPRARLDTLEIWTDETDPVWAEGLKGDGTVNLHDRGGLPPITRGILQRSERGAGLDLTPVRWKREEAARRARRKWLRTLGSVAAAWVLLLGGLFGVVQVRARRVTALERHNAGRNGEVNEVRQLAAQLRSLSQFTDRGRSALESLRLLAEAVPGAGGLRVEDFRYRKDDGMEFSGGLSGDVQSFYRFVETLSGQTGFEVDDYDLTQQENGYEFRVEAAWVWEEGL